jgi:hypothetical protein
MEEFGGCVIDDFMAYTSRTGGVCVGKFRYGLTVFGLLAWPAVLAALVGLAGFALWLILTAYLFGPQWVLLVLALISASAVLALGRATVELLRIARERLVREQANLVVVACACISIILTVLSRAGVVDRLFWGTAGLAWAVWAMAVLAAVRRPA